MFNIKTTWGDRHYVGLNGIEVFTSSGEQVKITKVRADPADINVLDEYSKDPRVVTNLIDGVNRTRDDVHVWLAPYIKGQDHKIFLTFDQPHIIAMMRIWVSRRFLASLFLVITKKKKKKKNSCDHLQGMIEDLMVKEKVRRRGLIS